MDRIGLLASFQSVKDIAIFHANLFSADAVKAWTLNANDMLDDDIDVLDSDVVLDAIDLKKPDPTTLKGNA